MDYLTYKARRGVNADDHERILEAPKIIYNYRSKESYGNTDGSLSYHHAYLEGRETKGSVIDPDDKARHKSSNKVSPTEISTECYGYTTDEHDLEKKTGTTADERGVRHIAELGINLGPSH